MTKLRCSRCNSTRHERTGYWVVLSCICCGHKFIEPHDESKLLDELEKRGNAI